MKLESFENWLVTRNKYRIYEEMKENGDVQNSNNPGTLKILKNVWKNFDHCWNYMMNLNNFFQTQRSIQWEDTGIRTWIWFKRFGILSSQLKMEIGICTCTHLRKCCVGFMLMTTITTQDTFHTTLRCLVNGEGDAYFSIFLQPHSSLLGPPCLLILKEWWGTKIVFVAKWAFLFM